MAVESRPWGSARLGQLLFVPCLSAPSCCSLPSEGTRRQAGCRQDRSHGTVLPVMELQGMRVNVQEMHREESTAGGERCE